jgi:hypothetical protein
MKTLNIQSSLFVNRSETSDILKRRSQSVEPHSLINKTSAESIIKDSSRTKAAFSLTTVETTTRSESSSPPIKSWFTKPGVQREAYFYLSRKDKGKVDKRWVVVSSTGLMFFKSKEVISQFLNQQSPNKTTK